MGNGHMSLAYFAGPGICGYGLWWVEGALGRFVLPSRVKIFSKGLKHSGLCLAQACLDCKYMNTALRGIELVISTFSHDIGTKTEFCGKW